MTLDLNQVAAQVKTMGQNLAEQQTLRAKIIEEAQALLRRYSTERDFLLERIDQAEKVQQQQRFDWVGAAPTTEALAQAYPLPDGPEQVTVMAGDGSQILPDPHAITLYYLINVGSIIYRHGSNRRPEIYNPQPLLCYSLEELLDGQGRLIPAGEIAVQRDLAELRVLTELAAAEKDNPDPVVALIDGQLTLRVIDLPFQRQEVCQDEYLAMLSDLRQASVSVAGYIDRPRSAFVLALLHLAALAPAAINEEHLRRNRFHALTDLELFDFLGPGQRSAILATRAKGLEKYGQSGHAPHFFYLNVSRNALPKIARVEIPAWLAANPSALDVLHATIIRQTRLTGGYPYVLARADELAVISREEREAVEMMLAVEMRRRGLSPALSLKQHHKNAFRAGKESFKP